MSSLIQYGGVLAPVALGAIAIWTLLPRQGNRAWVLGGMCGLAAVLAILGRLAPPTGEWVRDGLFYVFGGGAIVCGAMMITDRNPVYAALWFALVTLSTCGLFLLNSAPFLSVATVIVYAGAIVVTFLFVIMLAHQGDTGGYDSAAYQPVLGTVCGFLMMGAMLYTLQQWGGVDRQPGGNQSTVAAFALPPSELESNPLSRPRLGDMGSLNGVGRSLFGDYLFAVELAGAVLLIATIGAIAIAPRRSQGHL
ncbi:MAG TPA: NADH-quinone oxidoreductase subunit J [Planctomycetaceae bacterium]|nr:NADH-quinone oxidoreductase subunit J [Planctomycetaceae bacterium]